MLNEAREVCPTAAQRMSREGALLVDVRERDEIDRMAFAVADVVAIPMSEFELRCGELPRDRELIMVCAGGERSLKATYFLMYRGYEHVQNLQGGIARWARKGFPVKAADAADLAAPGAVRGCCAAAPNAAAAGAADAVAHPGCCAPSAKATGTCC